MPTTATLAPRPSERDTAMAKGSSSDTPPTQRGSAETVRRGLRELERSERLSPEELRSLTARRLEALVKFCAESVPFYRLRLREIATKRPFDWAVWRSIPVLERAEVQASGNELRAAAIPRAHGRVHELETAGSTGRPIRVAKTELANHVWSLLMLREHAWHRRDYRLSAAAIRWFPDGVNEYPHGGTLPTWGTPVSLLHETGPSYALSISASAADQVEWLGRVQPHYLLIYPSLVPDLARECRQQGVELKNLRHVLTVSECVDDNFREICRKQWGAALHDSYSAHEIGYIAIQCPEREHLHVQTETVHVEVLDEQSTPCGPGEIGRVVVTPLQNFAMPLIRYAIGDYAEVGPPCSCGRGLPVLRRIAGRTRNMVTLPDGRRFWPRLGELRYSEALTVSQYQVLQKELTRIELRLVAPRHGTELEEAKLRSILQMRLGYPFDIDIRYVERIERSPHGKFEEFKSELQ